MFGGRFDSIVAVFAEQFAADDAGFIYRKSQTGAAYRVSAPERDVMVAAFRSSLRYLMGCMVLGLLLTIVLTIYLASALEGFVFQFVMWSGIAFTIGAFSAATFWIWNAPERHFARRSPLSVELNREQARALKLSKITYGQLALVLPLALLLWWKIWQMTDPLHGWGLLGTAFAIGLVLLAAGQAFRKWRFERGGDIR